MDACTKCNGRLGETVDAATINQPLLAMIRQQFGIASYSGRVPDVVMPMRSMDTNEPGRMTIPPAGKVDYYHNPVVIREPHSIGEELFVAGSEDDVRRIVQGIADKEAKRGRRLADPSSGQTIDLEESIANAQLETTDLYRAETTVSLPPIYRTMIKAASDWRTTCSDGGGPVRRMPPVFATPPEA